MAVRSIRRIVQKREPRRDVGVSSCFSFFFGWRSLTMMISFLSFCMDPVCILCVVCCWQLGFSQTPPSPYFTRLTLKLYGINGYFVNISFLIFSLGPTTTDRPDQWLSIGWMISLQLRLLFRYLLYTTLRDWMFSGRPDAGGQRCEGWALGDLEVEVVHFGGLFASR